VPRLIVSPAALELHRAGVTVQDVADRLGLSRPAVSQYLSGKRRPHPRLLEAVAALAGEPTARRVARLVKARHAR